MNERFSDPGLAAERTILAWQRTALSIGAGALVFARIEATALGLWSWAFAAAGLAVAALIGIWSRRRYSYTHRTMVSGGARLADGLLPAVVAVSVAAAGMVALLIALLTEPPFAD
ncbi:MAG TPA: DUF202 domain-containing protein [Arachnia sp.]|nr:DUF202 domain-containing protein [Arachnia sp.]